MLIKFADHTKLEITASGRTQNGHKEVSRIRAVIWKWSSWQAELTLPRPPEYRMWEKMERARDARELMGGEQFKHRLPHRGRGPWLEGGGAQMSRNNPGFLGVPELKA